MTINRNLIFLMHYRSKRGRLPSTELALRTAAPVPPRVTLSNTAEWEGFAVAELRDLAGVLVAELRRCGAAPKRIRR